MPTTPQPAEPVSPSIPAAPAGDWPEGTVIRYFTRKEKVIRLLWVMVQATIFRFSPRRADRWRAFLLRRFGAKVGTPKLLRGTARFEVPWNIELGEGVTIGEGVRMYSLGKITVGDHSVISQYSHICAGTHDHESTAFQLIRVPITIGRHVWIGTDAFVAPGITIGDGVIVAARSNVVKDLPPWRICVGSPAKPIRPRILRDRYTGERLDPNTDEVPEPDTSEGAQG